jgi:hypothetical protein
MFKVMFAVFLSAVFSCIIVDNAYRVHRRQIYPVIAIQADIGRNITTSAKSLRPGCLFTSSTSLLIDIRDFYRKNHYRGE